jgi:tRNA nucleotidyltransferase (CCA-adding enzyme)
VMDWNPDSISQEKLHEYRRAAEAAWGDDTRHESYLGHPQPSVGQCYVTSRWLTTRLGGYVGSKDGHYFWVSPDRSHVVDLTGDQFAYKPADLRFNGVQLDEEDEPWEYHPEQNVHRPGPAMFKRADHPLYKGFRVEEFKTEIPRVKIFRERADAALAGKLSKQADFGFGGDAFPGQEPQVKERIEHDRPEPTGLEEYKWVFANGRLEISPHDDYDYLANLAGVTDDHSGPVALGTVDVSDGRAVWRASGNLGLSSLAPALQDHTRTVGWTWGGLNSLEGDQRLAYSLYYMVEDNGHVVMSHNPEHIPTWPANCGEVRVVGRTASVISHGATLPNVAEALQEWADDHKIALNTGIKTPEDIDGYNTYGPRPDYAQGPTDITPPSGTLRCPECGQVFPSFGLYILHRKEEEPRGDELDREDGHFPEMDMDKVLPPHFHDREPRIFPLAHNAHKIASHEDKMWASAAHIDLGAFIDGDLVGQATITNTGNIEAVTVLKAPEQVFGALVRDAGRRFDELTYAGEDPRVLTRLRKMGFVDGSDGPYVKWAKGKEPMDMIDKPIPFIFDVEKDEIQLGTPGSSHGNIFGQFTPGGILEGMYEPGGVITITNQTDYPWTTRHLVDLWYWSLPHMRVKDVQYKDPMGQTQKLTRTAQHVGQYVRNLAATDPAVWRAYKALEAAGGEVFAVGGVVRDALMGEESNDIDLMVRGLHQDQVNDILNKLPGKVDLTGKSFGVFRYNHKGHEVEIALPRTERSTGDRRVDFDVNVDHTLPIEDDLLRRDFTINSPAVSLSDGRLVDPYGAADDIKNRVLRTTHPNSFKEDPTRLLRALVMNARYGVQPDERTRAEMENLGHSIHNESWDNMNGIMDKLLKSKNPASGIRLAQETGLLKHIFPELASAWDYDQRNPHHKHLLGPHHMHVLEGVSEQTTDPDLRLAALLHDIGKPASRAMKCMDCNNVWHEDDRPDDPFTCPKCGSSNTKGTFHGGDGVGHDHAVMGASMADPRLTHMKWPTGRKNRIVNIIRHHMFPAFSTGKGARKFLNRVGDHADDLLMLRHADMYGKGTDEAQNEKTQVDDMRRLVEEARTTGAPTALSGLAINGGDLLAIGIPQGPQIGQTLNTLMQAVVENPELNDREQLLALAQGQANAPTDQAFT